MRAKQSQKQNLNHKGRSVAEPQPKPLHHGGTETRRLHGEKQDQLQNLKGEITENPGGHGKERALKICAKKHDLEPRCTTEQQSHNQNPSTTEDTKEHGGKAKPSQAQIKTFEPRIHANKREFKNQGMKKNDENLREKTRFRITLYYGGHGGMQSEAKENL